MAFKAVSPTTGEVIREQLPHSLEEAQEAIDLAQDGLRHWSRTPFENRARLLRTMAGLLEQRTDRYARLIAQEMGKPISQGVAEVEKCARACRFYAERGEEFLASDVEEEGETRNVVAYRPLGVLLAIMPWNFPFWQVFRFTAPAIMAGNTVLLKPAPGVPGCAQAVQDLLREAGVPAAVFQTLFVELREVPHLIADPRVRGVTLTGSTRAGRSVAELAGRNLKKTVLELGGSDPYVVLSDADLDVAVEAGVRSRLLNAGQSCIAAKRFIVVEELREAFQDRLVEKMKEATVGSPTDPETDVGPLAREDLRAELHRQVRESVEGGAKLLLGGEIPKGPGWYYPPSVLTEVGPGIPAYQEELFGPVAAIIGAADDPEAIRVANDNSYGLGAAVFTRDRARGERIAVEEIEAGACFVNDLVRSDPSLPFGGVKDSGYGRELSHFGIREFVNVKTVSVR